MSSTVLRTTSADLSIQGWLGTNYYYDVLTVIYNYFSWFRTWKIKFRRYEINQTTVKSKQRRRRRSRVPYNIYQDKKQQSKADNNRSRTGTRAINHVKKGIRQEILQGKIDWWDLARREFLGGDCKETCQRRVPYLT